MYLCKNCGYNFSIPAEAPDGFEHAFGFHLRTKNVCPHCGDEAYEAAKLCENPYCDNAYIATDEVMCDSCKRDLYKHLCDFLDTLTSVDIKQLDLWLDGSSLAESEDWSVARDS